MRQPDYVLRLADNPLILGQRLSEWCGHAPVLEEDIALTNIALDLIGQARLLLAHAAAIRGDGGEDSLAFLRDVEAFRNVTLVELPNGDYAHTTVRNVLFFAYQCELWHALRASSDAQLAAIAAKSLKEANYHWRHSADWLLRLGDGTEESHARAQAALDELWRYSRELFADDEVDAAAAEGGAGVLPSSLESAWLARVQPVIAQATLAIPPATAFCSRGKFGYHSEHLGYVLAEMQFMQRAYPGAQW
jgi:ring-1,2-phenylacetyl-CoA epoxidase subunit PaaC